jgi:hypothetical protein
MCNTLGDNQCENRPQSSHPSDNRPLELPPQFFLKFENQMGYITKLIFNSQEVKIRLGAFVVVKFRLKVKLVNK